MASVFGATAAGAFGLLGISSPVSTASTPKMEGLINSATHFVSNLVNFFNLLIVRDTRPPASERPSAHLNAGRTPATVRA